ncbi:MAG TPA: hypothetical protein VG826_03870 [Pirellulales bacterium]|nr:hypothetical protein [Pirellulales bacterium]
MRLPLLHGFIRRASVVSLLCTGLALLSLLDRPTSAKDKESDELSASERASQLETMRKIARSITICELSGEKRSPLRLLDEPVLRYADNTRRSHDSTIWIWTSGGRPGALVGVEYYPERPREPKWLSEIVSLSADRIAVEREKKTIWTAREPGLRLQSLPDAPQPARKPAARLAQMKQFLRRFTAHERAVVEGRIELRPLNQPLYRYDDDEARTSDGAIFAFANGTNPEVLLVLEGQSDGWKFAFAQLTGAEVFAELDGKQVWECPDADPPAVRDSYFNSWVAGEAE